MEIVVIDRGTELWEKHKAGLERALSHSIDGRTLTDVVDAFLDGRAQFWADEDAMIVTECFEPEGRVHIWLVTGDFDACLDLSNRIFEWARQVGYDKVTGSGRRGWAKIMKTHGWREVGVVLTKDI